MKSKQSIFLKMSQEESLLAGDPSAVISFIYDHPLNKEKDHSFNWYGLAQGADDNARTELDLNWALVATLIYENLFNSRESDQVQESYDYDIYLRYAMGLRADMIQQFGIVPGDAILDVNHLLRLFDANLTMTYEEALSASTEYGHRMQTHTLKGMDGKKRAKIGAIKDRLVILEGLVVSQHLQPDVQLSKWISMLEQFPNRGR